MLKELFNWFNEEKLLKRFKELNKQAERIAGDMHAAIANQKITISDLQQIREGAAMTRVTLDALLEQAKLYESQLNAVISREAEEVELMDDTRRRIVNYIDASNDAAMLAGNAADALLSTPEAAARLLTMFNPKVLRVACDILADKEDWATLGMLYDVAKDRLDGRRTE